MNDNNWHKKKFKSGDSSIELSTMRLPVKQQLKLKFQLIQMFADIGGALGSLLAGDDGVSDDNANAIMALTGSVKTLDADELIDLLVTLCQYTNEVGKDKGRVSYDYVFDQLPMVLTYKVALWVLEVNFKDFIEESGLMSVLKKMGNSLPAPE